MIVRTSLALLVACGSVGVCIGGCSAPAAPLGDRPAEVAAGGGPTTVPVGGSGATVGGKPGIVLMPDLSAGGRGGTGGCASLGPDGDADGDGLTPAQGDCNDCDAVVGPGAYDFPANGVDEDCSGQPDDEVTSCDADLAIEGNEPLDAARALGLCRMQQGSTWGVLAARWVFPDGTMASVEPADRERLDDCVRAGNPPNPQSRGILPTFGPNVSPTQGARLVALSSGVARAGETATQQPASGTSPLEAAMCTASLAPPGFPKDSPSCPDITTADDRTALDAIALELEIKAPTNAKALSFDFTFYTYEWPEYVCNVYNDFFVALLKSGHPSVPVDQNISFDSKSNPVSVNNGFVDVCDPKIGASKPGGKDFPCAAGVGALKGTGFSEKETSPQHAATGWLRTTSAIVPGETIRLRFAVWDMADEALDSTVLLDHFVWELSAASTPVTERVPTVK